MLTLDVQTSPYDLAGTVAASWSDDDIMELITSLDSAVDDWAFTKQVHDYFRSERRNFISMSSKGDWNDLA